MLFIVFLVDLYFSFSTLNRSSHSPLTCKISAESIEFCWKIHWYSYGDFIVMDKLHFSCSLKILFSFDFSVIWLECVLVCISLKSFFFPKGGGRCCFLDLDVHFLPQICGFLSHFSFEKSFKSFPVSCFGIPIMHILVHMILSNNSYFLYYFSFFLLLLWWIISNEFLKNSVILSFVWFSVLFYPPGIFSVRLFFSSTTWFLLGVL